MDKVSASVSQLPRGHVDGVLRKAAALGLRPQRVEVAAAWRALVASAARGAE